MTEKLSNTVASTLSNTDVSGYIRAAMIDLRDKQKNETKVWQNVFERQI